MNGDEQSTERTVLVGWVQPKAKPNAFKNFRLPNTPRQTKHCKSNLQIATIPIPLLTKEGLGEVMNGDEQSTERTVLVGWVQPKAKPNAFKNFRLPNTPRQTKHCKSNLQIATIPIPLLTKEGLGEVMNGDEQSTERTVLVGWVQPKAKPNAFRTAGFQIHPAKQNTVKAISKSRLYPSPSLLRRG